MRAFFFNLCITHFFALSAVFIESLYTTNLQKRNSVTIFVIMVTARTMYFPRPSPKLKCAVASDPSHVESGVKEITLNGEKLEGCYIPADKLADANEITVIMG